MAIGDLTCEGCAYVYTDGEKTERCCRYPKVPIIGKIISIARRGDVVLDWEHPPSDGRCGEYTEPV